MRWIDSGEGEREPVRTCIGCRSKEPKSLLVRLVAVDGRCVVDSRTRLPGRGAYVHPDPRCLASAVRRRALPRALRVQAPFDTTVLQDLAQSLGGPAAQPDRDETAGAERK